jgi:Ca2+-binding EF-hand superfamily protein
LSSGVLNEINKFRENPLSVEKRLQSFKLGLSRLRANDPFIREIENFIHDLGNLRKNPPLELNDTLCEAAQGQLSEFTSDPEAYKNYREGDELVNIVPHHYLKENPVLLVDDGAEEPYEVLNKFLLNKLDPRQFGRRTLCSSEITQIGIAHALKDGDNYVVCIFAYKKAKKRSAIPLPEGDLGELKQAFDLFDVNHEEEISPKDTVEAMKSLGYDKKNPELYRIMKELDTPENETIDFPLFANHIMGSITDKYNLEGIRTIFNLFVDDPKEGTISLINLKKIIEELGEKPSEKEINRLLEIKGSANMKLTFDEFYDFMQKVYGEDMPKMEVINENQYHKGGKTVQTTTTTTVFTTKSKGGTVDKTSKTQKVTNRRY